MEEGKHDPRLSLFNGKSDYLHNTTCNKTLLNSNVGLGLEKLGLNKGICGCRVEMYVQ